MLALDRGSLIKSGFSPDGGTAALRCYTAIPLFREQLTRRMLKGCEGWPFKLCVCMFGAEKKSVLSAFILLAFIL